MQLSIGIGLAVWDTASKSPQDTFDRLGEGI